MNTLKRRGAFISYSRTDKDFALALARELRAASYLVWLDQLDIPTGARWDDEVEKALREHEIFLIILTPASVSSENVKDEIGYAIDHGKRLLPILLKPCDVPLRLRRFQYVDFTKIEFKEGLQRTKQLLEDLLQEQPTPAGTISPAPEGQKASGQEARPSYVLPEIKKPARGQKIGIGVVILLLIACLGLLGIMILARGLSFPGTPTRTPMASNVLVTATALQINTSPSVTEGSQTANYKPMSQSSAVITDRNGTQTTVPADTLRWCTSAGEALQLDNGDNVALDTIQRIDIVRAAPAGGKTLFSITLLDGTTIQKEGLTCSFISQTSLGHQEFWTDQIQSVEILRK